MREIGNKYVLFIDETPYLLFDEYKVSHEYKEGKVMNELKLEFGKKYVTRGGDIVTIIRYDSNYSINGVKYPYIGSNYRTYRQDGDFFVGDENEFDDSDIIKEYEEIN